MGIEKIQIKSDSEIEKDRIKEVILNGEMDRLLENKEEAKEILFNLASENINLYHGVSALEFIIIGSLRVLNKQVNNLPFNETDLKIKETLDEVLSNHELSDETISSADWKMDYLSYIKRNSMKVLQNRDAYIEKKQMLNNTEES